MHAQVPNFFCYVPCAMLDVKIMEGRKQTEECLQSLPSFLWEPRAQKGHFCACRMKWRTAAIYAMLPGVSRGAQGVVLASVICIIVVPSSSAFIDMVTGNSGEINALNQTSQCDLRRFILHKCRCGICKDRDLPLALQLILVGPEKGKDRGGKSSFFSPPIYRGENIFQILGNNPVISI